MKPLLFAIALISVAAGSSASTLSTFTTPTYKITIEVRCPEGEVSCDNVKYVGVNKKNGKSITLIGREIHSTGPDGATPAHFLGYLFKNGGTQYFVGEDGDLEVTRGSKTLVDEQGTWDWECPASALK